MELKIILFFVCFLSSNVAMASFFNKAVMPGKLVLSHAKYENDCETCHDLFNKDNISKKCLSCHKKIRTDVKKGDRYHGLHPKIKNDNCILCHSDHMGRNADILMFDPLLFEHEYTNFKLKGIHKQLVCMRCHKKENKYRNTKTTCFDCHEKQDVHEQKLGKKCSNCHDNTSWEKARFDHEKTKFSLQGKHKKVPCLSCHVTQDFKNTSKDCFACHILEDVHVAIFGNKCGKCHSIKTWEKTTFNHEKDSKFKLRGMHKKVACKACHTTPTNKESKAGKERVCLSCHETEDIHVLRFGDECEDCHSEKAWGKIGFDHDRDTKYKLRHRHKYIDCEACHQAPSAGFELKKDCIACHKNRDVHREGLGKKCEECHEPKTWVYDLVFDHELTDYPLIGLHSITLCESCHLNKRYQLDNLHCYACHEKQDVHKYRLGESCESCHTPNGWRQWVFDHENTDFPLKGRHLLVQCESCHKEKIKKISQIKVSRKCISCHVDDDKHDGRYGKNCDLCHNTEEFLQLNTRFSGRDDD